MSQFAKESGRSCSLVGAETMAAARTVKDVSPHEFVKAYAAHLKRSGKVLVFLGFRTRFLAVGRWFSVSPNNDLCFSALFT